MATPARTAPRFVPTLTDIVHEDGPAASAPGAGAAACPAMPAPGHGPGSMPVEAAATPALDAAPASAAPTGTPALAADFEEHMVHRVLQRVDLVLEQRLQEAIARVVQEQTRSLIPRLREEVETVVRQSVYAAVAQELAGERPAA